MRAPSKRKISAWRTPVSSPVLSRNRERARSRGRSVVEIQKAAEPLGTADAAALAHLSN
jgi:hypothetical protein